MFFGFLRCPTNLFTGTLPMTVAIQATTPATFEIKSANLPLVALLLKSTDLGALQRELKRRFGDIPDFFDQDALVIDLSMLPAEAKGDQNPSAIDFPVLIKLLREYRLNPIAIKGAGNAHLAAAIAAGLLPSPDAYVGGSSIKNLAPVLEQSTQARQVPDAVTPAVQGQLSALVIEKPLRSGQQIYARGRDLVVLAMVNAGAEVIADGHIHVYAPLRGKAIAGARGNTEARIFALALDAELLSIAGVYRTSENPLPSGVKGKPTQVRLVSTPDGDKLMMDAM